MLSKNGSVPALHHVGRSLQPPCSRFGRVRLGFRIAQDQGFHPRTVLPPKFEQHIAANRDSHEWSASYFFMIQNSSDVRSMLLHDGWTCANARVSVPAQIGENDPVV